MILVNDKDSACINGVSCKPSLKKKAKKVEQGVTIRKDWLSMVEIHTWLPITTASKAKLNKIWNSKNITFFYKDETIDLFYIALVLSSLLDKTLWNLEPFIWHYKKNTGIPKQEIHILDRKVTKTNKFVHRAINISL